MPPASLTQKFLQEAQQHCDRLTGDAQERIYRVPADAPLTALARAADEDARYQTILSFGCTPALASIERHIFEQYILERYVAALKLILAPDGWIFMVEPTRPNGGSTQRSKLRSILGRRDAGPDLVTALRGDGLFVTDVERLTAQRLPRRWQYYVVLKARRPSSACG